MTSFPIFALFVGLFLGIFGFTLSVPIDSKSRASSLKLFTFINPGGKAEELEVDEQCGIEQSLTRPMIYGADTLPNGTIRLYSGLKVWELYIFEVKGTPGDRPVNVLLSYNGSDYGTAARLMMDVHPGSFYPGMRASIGVADSFATAWLLPVDANDKSYEGTFVLEMPQTYHHWLMNLNRSYVKNDIFKPTHHPQSVQAAFVLNIGGEQMLIMDIADKLYCDRINLIRGSNQLNRVLCSKNLIVGSLPIRLTAVFTIEVAKPKPAEPKPTQWIVFIRCDTFCLVPMIDEKIRLDKCEMTSIDKLLHLGETIQLTAKNNRLMPLSRNLASLNHIQSFGFNSTSFIPPLDGFNGTGIHGSNDWLVDLNEWRSWRFFDIDFDFIVYGTLVVLALMLIVGAIIFMFNLDCRPNATYELAKTEVRDMRQQLAEVGQQVERASSFSVTHVESGSDDPIA